MSISNLISHRLFVSALAQEPRTDAFEEAVVDPSLDSQPATAVQVEVMPGRDPLDPWIDDDPAFRQPGRNW